MAAKKKPRSRKRPLSALSIHLSVNQDALAEALAMVDESPAAALVELGRVLGQLDVLSDVDIWGAELDDESLREIDARRDVVWHHVRTIGQRLRVGGIFGRPALREF